MDTSSPTLHLLCGKIAAGKSTLAARLAAPPDTVLIAQDDWLAALYADQLHSPADYLRCTERLNTALGPHIAELLRAGLSVVLDFPANTRRDRAWMRDLVTRTGVAHQMHVLDLPDEVCLRRLRARNADGSHPFQVSDADFARFTAHFDLPAPDEGFELVHHAHVS